MGTSSIVPVQYISTKPFKFIVPVLCGSTNTWFYVDLPALCLRRQTHVRSTDLSSVQGELHSFVTVPVPHWQSISQDLRSALLDMAW